MRSSNSRSVVRTGWLISCAVIAALTIGCASTSVEQTRRAGALEKPDRILVRNFAVTMADIELDRGLGPTIARDAAGEVEGGGQVKLGRAAADALADELTQKLREAGLPAQRSTGRVALTPTTAVISGKFLTLDEGNQTMRTLVGFGRARARSARACRSGWTVSSSPRPRPRRRAARSRAPR
jgi:hypothetical protein